MKHFFLILTLSLLSVAASFATNGTKMNGFDARTIGRGGATIGFFDNTSLMFTNPAGLSFLGGTQVDADFSMMVPSLTFSNGINDAVGKTNYFPMFDAGYVRNNGSNFTWGAGVYTQGGMGADFTLNHQLFVDQSGNYVQQTYHSKLAVMEGGLSGAYKLTPNFSVGASAQAVYSMLEFSMPYSLLPSAMKGVVNPLTGMTFGDMFAAPPQSGGFGYTEVTAAAAMTGLKAFGFSGKFGIAWNANENVTLGASYTSPTTLSYKSGSASMDMTYQLNDAFGKAVQGVMMQNPGMTRQQAQQAVMTMFSGLGIDLAKGVAATYGLEAKLKLPQSIAVGGMFRMADNLRMAFDFEWVNWKNAFDQMSLTLKNGNNANINRMMGNDGNFTIAFPMNWQDAGCARLGLEYDATGALTLRLGGAFGTNPVPNTTVFPVFPAIVENHVTAGVSYKFSPSFTLHAAYERALNASETALNPSIIAQEYSGSASQLAENIFHISATWMP